jgi:uncharacterized protein YdaU (DUF1376 family)
MTRRRRAQTFAAFQFYPRDFLASDKVARMNLEELGMYILLLCYSWLGEGLPVNPKELARLCHLPVRRFERIWSGVLGECFIIRNHKWINPRQERQRAELQKYVASCTKGGENSAKTRKSRYGTAKPLHSHFRGHFGGHFGSDREVTANTASASASASAKKEEDGAARRTRQRKTPKEHPHADKRNPRRWDHVMWDCPHENPCASVFECQELRKPVSNH